MKKYQEIIIAIALLLIAIFTVYLFYNQAMGNFESDLEQHLENAFNGSQYSIIGHIYRCIYMIGGNFGIAIFLSIVTILNIYVTKKVLEHFIEEKNEFLLSIYAFLLNFVIAIYIPFIFKNWVVGVQEPTEWHNSTYICMKPLGELAVLLYFYIEKNYLQKIDIGSYILFCAVLILANMVKPNFIIAFAPTMLVFLIIDFFKNIKNKKAIQNIIIFGCAVLISLPILFYQQSILYNEESNNRIQLGFMTVLRFYNKTPIISLIQSAAFPLFVLITNFKTIIKNRNYCFVFVLNVIALTQYIFLEEAGKRAIDGNFTWGYSFSLMIAFISSVALITNSKKTENHKKVYYVVGYTLLALHILSGLVHFGRLLLGYSYS